ncbi:substrate-binding periplasmic protein [Pseudodesulfovibrio senegalensis]|uniref:Transporter substrate-binding domain-containing protein n=1 Tax=Pseudodesulfovibrio senegalensis TaxID=1721087 RepID=A0A6N6MZ75_9BACT|nr:transporter substrate-binding domain-containing protein [Pseudodesulfovibrio senegalensis]KAB1440915.1 transporter substrate-binding domain-containing protein [Pseudodesulfovibrio senegalensis]
MNSASRIAAAMLFCMVLLTAHSSLCEQKGMHLVFENQPYAGYICGDGYTVPKNRPGLAVELITMTAKRLGIALSLERMPWKRCLYTVRSGQADGIFPVSQNRDRSRFLAFPSEAPGQPKTTMALCNRSHSFFTLKQSRISWDGMELRNLGSAPVATGTGYTFIHTLDSMGIRHVEFPTQSECFEKLQQGLVGAVATLDDMGQSVLAEHPELLRNVVKLSPPIGSNHYYLAFSRNFVRHNPALVQRFWKTMYAVARSKEFSSIRNTYAANLPH